MPRLNLTDEEAEVIVRWRQKHAVDLEWNAALGLAGTIVDALISKTGHVDTGESARLIVAIKDQLNAQRRAIKLP